MVKKITPYKILIKFLNNYERKYYLRELADLFKTSHQAIKPHIEYLVSVNILFKEKRRNLVEYSLNFKNYQIYSYLSIAEYENLIQVLKKEILLKTLFEKVCPFFEKNKFVIFGSSVLNMKDSNDIDLLVVGNSNLDNVVEEFEQVYNKKIHLIQISSLHKISKVLLKEIYKNHIILNNPEEFILHFENIYGKNKLV
jgi:predicted nucleotidyltransferase